MTSEMETHQYGSKSKAGYPGTSLLRNKNQERRQIDAKIHPVVTVREGKLRGSLNKLNDGREFYSFKGIPYAQPPVGDLRFKAPLPLKPWSGIMDALEHGPICPQVDILKGNIRDGDENCLFLNVYTLSLQTDSKLPVIFFIHPGGFSSGSGDSKLLEVLGFLCLDTPEVPGNAGMKDQVAALRWVQKNITQFGGDPDNVTIVGESAGAIAVTYFMLSPMTKGLFHKAIAQSGTCLSDFALDFNPRARAFRVAKFFGKNTNDPYELLGYLQSLRASQLVSLATKTATSQEMSGVVPLYFVPVVEKKFGDNEVFLTENPLDLMLAGKFHPVPFITGYNSSEGLMLLQNEKSKLINIHKQPSCLVPRQICMNVSAGKVLEFGYRIRQFYWSNKDLTADDPKIVTDILTDAYFLTGIQKHAKLYSKYCNTIYMYRFNLVTKLNWFQQTKKLTAVKGACHFDDVFYFFCNYYTEDICKKYPELQKYVYRLTKLLTNFAKTSDPTPDDSLGIKWPLYTSSSREYLHFEEELSIGKDAEKERMDFWTKMYDDAGLSYITKSHL